MSVCAHAERCRRFKTAGSALVWPRLPVNIPPVTIRNFIYRRFSLPDRCIPVRFPRVCVLPMLIATRPMFSSIFRAQFVDTNAESRHNYRLRSEGFPSGQRGQTVNLLAQPSKVRILPPPPGFCRCAWKMLRQRYADSRIGVAGSECLKVP